jgi:hypothetical protein
MFLGDVLPFRPRWRAKITTYHEMRGRTWALMIFGHISLAEATAIDRKIRERQRRIVVRLKSAGRPENKASNLYGIRV